jgi:hypothetical protein
LLRLLSHVAQRLNVGTVWAETTSTSVGFYWNMLNRNNFQDLLTMSEAEFCDRFGVRD